MRGKRQKKHSKMWLLIKLIIIYLIVLTAVCLYMTAKFSFEPSTIISMNFTVFGVELCAMMVKRIMDDRNNKNG